MNISIKSIMTDDYDHCFVCGLPATDYHHCFHGADKKLSEETGCMVPLCRKCHERVHHVGGEYDRLLKVEAQRAYLREVFGKCYL